MSWCACVPAGAATMSPLRTGTVVSPNRYSPSPDTTKKQLVHDVMPMEGKRFLAGRYDVHRATQTIEPHRWAPIHQTPNEIPVLEPGIVVEVRSDLRPTLLLKLSNEVEPHLIGEHVAYGIEVARVEALDISGEQRALGFSQNGQRNVVGLPCQLAQAGTAAMQGRLHGRNAHIHDAADFLEGIAEHVHEDDAAALRHRKAHEGLEARGRGLPICRDG